MGYTKLDENLVTSSIWSEDDKTLRVWCYLMARADSNGWVLDTIPAIARACNYDIETVETILQKFAGPDKYSRTKDHEGRRIAILNEPEFGIYLLNHPKYREKDHTAAERQRRHRAAKVTGDVTAVTRDKRDVTQETVTVTQAEAESKAKAESESEQSVAVDPTPSIESTGSLSPSEPALPELSEYGAAIVAAWHKARGSDFPQPSNRDFTQLSDWHGSGIPLRVVLRGIQDCIEGMARRRDGPKGKPLAYYNSAVRVAYGQWRKAIA